MEIWIFVVLFAYMAGTGIWIRVLFDRLQEQSEVIVSLSLKNKRLNDDLEEIRSRLVKARRKTTKQ
jgi:hypothetical protein